MYAYTLIMYKSLKKLLINLTTLACCLHVSVLWSQEAKKTDDAKTTDAENTTPLEIAKPIRIPGNQKRSQFPLNDGSDKGHMDALATQISNSLSPQLPEDAIVWLGTTANEKFLSLWRPDRSGNPRGALLIVHSEGEHIAWPDSTGPLHETLPDYGWATLALSLPEPALSQTPKRTLAVKSLPSPKTEASADSKEDPEDPKKSEAMVAEKTAAEKTDESKTNKPLEVKTAAQEELPAKSSRLPEEITEQRLATALRFLHDKGQFNIVILGSGTGAIRANTFLNNTTPKIDNPDLGAAKPFSGIILLNSRNRLPTMEQDYTEWFADPEIPVLDIFLSKDLRNFKAAKARKIVAKQKKVVLYKQVKLNHLTATSVAQENLLSRRIRSYLSANLEGIETSAFKKNTVN
jgi:hypothetical protein